MCFSCLEGDILKSKRILVKTNAAPRLASKVSSIIHVRIRIGNNTVREQIMKNLNFIPLLTNESNLKINVV